MEDFSLITNDGIIIADWYIVYMEHFIVGNSSYKPFLSLIFQGIPKHLPKTVFAIPDEYALRAGNIGSIKILDVYVVVLIDKEEGFISEMTCASFG